MCIGEERLSDLRGNPPSLLAMPPVTVSIYRTFGPLYKIVNTTIKITARRGQRRDLG